MGFLQEMRDTLVLPTFIPPAWEDSLVMEFIFWATIDLGVFWDSLTEKKMFRVLANVNPPGAIMFATLISCSISCAAY